MDMFFARQPIYDREMRVVAYELLYRPGNTADAGDIENPEAASSQVIMNSFMEIGINRVTAGLPALVNVTKEFILKGGLPIQYQDQLIPELLEDIEVDDALVAHVSDLVQQGYRIALDDFEYSEEWRPLVDQAYIIKIDVMALGVEGTEQQLHKIGNVKAKMLAEKVETHDEFELYRKMGFDYFQGYFFARPKVIKAKDVSVAKHLILSLISELNAKEVDFEQLVQIVSQDARLSFRLLKVVNSAANGLPRTIKSIREGVVVAGIRDIQTFATLLALMDDGSKPIGLLITAIVRGKMCQFLAEKLKLPDADSYFTIGLFSLLDALLDMPLAEALAETQLSPEVTSAVAEYAGRMGAILKFVVAYEAGNWDEVAEHDFLVEKTSLGMLSRDDIYDAYLSAIEWSEQARSKMES